MPTTRLKKTSFLMTLSIVLIFGSQLGSQIRNLNSKIKCFSLSWANLGQLGHKRRSKTPQESQNETKRRPKRAQMRPKGAPRERKWGQKRSTGAKLTPQSAPRHPQDNQATICWKDSCMNLYSGDPPFLVLKGEASKRSPRGNCERFCEDWAAFCWFSFAFPWCFWVSGLANVPGHVCFVLHSLVTKSTLKLFKVRDTL